MTRNKMKIENNGIALGASLLRKSNFLLGVYRSTWKTRLNGFNAVEDRPGLFKMHSFYNGEVKLIASYTFSMRNCHVSACAHAQQIRTTRHRVDVLINIFPRFAVQARCKRAEYTYAYVFRLPRMVISIHKVQA